MSWLWRRSDEHLAPFRSRLNYSEERDRLHGHGHRRKGNATVGRLRGRRIGDTYTFDLTPTGQGLVTADIAAGVAQDAAGNGNSAATQFSRTFEQPSRRA